MKINFSSKVFLACVVVYICLAIFSAAAPILMEVTPLMKVQMMQIGETLGLVGIVSLVCAVFGYMISGCMHAVRRLRAA